MKCMFCSIFESNRYLFETESFLGVWDINPVQQGHLLIISKNHIMNISELNDRELHEMVLLQKGLVRIFECQAEVLGVTTLYNNGKIMMHNTHFHFHIIPRYQDDGFYDNQTIIQHNLNKSFIEVQLQQKFDGQKMQ